MPRYTMQYPGDPPCVVEKMNRKEFLEKFPRTPTRIESWNPDLAMWDVEEFEVLPDAVYCDLCNEDPVDEIYVVRSNAYCANCANKSLIPYCKTA